MHFDRSTSSLYSSTGKHLKTFFCPKGLTPSDLRNLHSSTERFCDACGCVVKSIDGMDEAAVENLITKNPNQCLYFKDIRSSTNCNMQLQDFSASSEGAGTDATSHASDSPSGQNYIEYVNNLPTIATIRGVESVSRASESGARLVIKPVVLNRLIESRAEVWRHRATNQLWFNDDYDFSQCDISQGGENWDPIYEGVIIRPNPPVGPLADWELIISRFYYRPNPPVGPIAAYVIPVGLNPGDHVLILDLIEDIEIPTIPYGNVDRLQSGTATWDGQSFDIDFLRERQQVVG